MEQQLVGLTGDNQDKPSVLPRRMDTFRRVEWSLAQCGIACGILVAFRVTFVVLGRLHAARPVLYWTKTLSESIIREPGTGKSVLNTGKNDGPLGMSVLWHVVVTPEQVAEYDGA